MAIQCACIRKYKRKIQARNKDSKREYWFRDDVKHTTEHREDDPGSIYECLYKKRVPLVLMKVKKGLPQSLYNWDM